MSRDAFARIDDRKWVRRDCVEISFTVRNDGIVWQLNISQACSVRQLFVLRRTPLHKTPNWSAICFFTYSHLFLVKPGQQPRCTFLAAAIEEAIFTEFRDTGVKYKNRVRSRFSNLKDSKNEGLRLNVINGVLSPEKIAKMTAEVRLVHCAAFFLFTKVHTGIFCTSHWV